ncbi:MAG: hypothetical protein NXI16_16750 [Alphaproteobacteria bacterium]|nr:hypothetical protein [Alphaproteobacteria bacterium]
MSTEQAMDDAVRLMVSDAYDETVSEALSHDQSVLTAHKEGVVAAAMLYSAMTGIEDEEAKRCIVALGLKPDRVRE